MLIKATAKPITVKTTEFVALPVCGNVEESVLDDGVVPSVELVGSVESVPVLDGQSDVEP